MSDESETGKGNQIFEKVGQRLKFEEVLERKAESRTQMYKILHHEGSAKNVPGKHNRACTEQNQYRPTHHQLE